MRMGVIGTSGRFDGTYKVLGAALVVHRRLGPGLLESADRACMGRQLLADGMAVKQEVPISIDYLGLPLETAYRADLIVDDKVLIELKALERLLPIHEAQLLTYLKLARIKTGLLINFNVTRLQSGVRRFVV